MSNTQNWQPYEYNAYNRPYYQEPTTNAIFVTSLEEAIMRTTIKGSEMIYFHQDKPVFYRVKMDVEGRKYWQELYYNSNPTSDDFVTIKYLEDKLKELEERLTNKEVKQDV